MSERGTVASDPQNDASEADEDRSRFEHLFEQIDSWDRSGVNSKRESKSTPSDTESKSVSETESTGHQGSTDRPDANHQLVPVDIHPIARAKQISPDGKKVPSSNRKLIAGIAFGVVLALVVPTIIALPVIDVTDRFSASSPPGEITADGTLTLGSDEAVYLNRVFGETTHEVAYCGQITETDGSLHMDVWMADTVSASPHDIEFDAHNCPSEFHDVQLHTHPSGSLALSDVDEETLEAGPWEIMCVQGGELTTEPGTDVENLACYNEVQTPDGEFDTERMAVSIVE